MSLFVSFISILYFAFIDFILTRKMSDDAKKAEEKKEKQKKVIIIIVVIVVILIILIAAGVGGYMYWRKKKRTNTIDNVNVTVTPGTTPSIGTAAVAARKGRQGTVNVTSVNGLSFGGNLPNANSLTARNLRLDFGTNTYILTFTDNMGRSMRQVSSFRVDPSNLKLYLYGTSGECSKNQTAVITISDPKLSPLMAKVDSSNIIGLVRGESFTLNKI